MADNTHIEWTDATWNPVTGCSVVSPGCTNCYAMKLAGGRLRGHPSRAGLTRPSKAGPVWTGEVRLNEPWIDQPLRWTRPRHIFVCAHGDLFHDAVSDAWIDRVFAIMALSPQHTFQVLTKRAARMRAYMTDPATPRRVWEAACEIRDTLYALAANGATWGGEAPWPLRNVWLGVSAEDQARTDERVPELARTPAALRFVSYEPALGPADFTAIPLPPSWPRCDCPDAQPTYNALDASIYCEGCCEGPEATTCGRLDWVIVGGESGAGARPMHPDWPRQIRDACADAGVPFFFKQWGEWAPCEAVEGPHKPLCALTPDGRRADGPTSPADPEDEAYWTTWIFEKVGKEAAGRLLDGRNWDERPVL